MGKQHQTIPVEPEEAPLKQPLPEIKQPADPQQPRIPPEAPDQETEEVPRQPDITRKTARMGLGAGLIQAGIGHLSFARKEFRAQVPDWVPFRKDDTVFYSGIAEIVLGSALVLAPEKYAYSIGKVAAGFFTAVFPGNIAQYQDHRTAFGLDTDQKRLARLFFQPLLVLWALKSTTARKTNSQIAR